MPVIVCELNVDSVVADEELHDVDGNKVYEEVVANAEAEIQKARDLLVQEIGEEELPRECLGVIDLSGGAVAEAELKAPVDGPCFCLPNRRFVLSERNLLSRVGAGEGGVGSRVRARFSF